MRSNICFDFFFSSCSHNIYILIVIRLFKVFSSSYSLWNCCLFNMKKDDIQLAQPRCDNVVTTLWHGRKWKLYRRQFPTLWQNRPPMFPQCCYNVAATLCIGFLGHFTTDYSDFFPFIETWQSYRCAKWH